MKIDIATNNVQTTTKGFLKMQIATDMINIFCVQIPSPIFSDIPEDLFTTLSHLR